MNYLILSLTAMEDTIAQITSVCAPRYRCFLSKNIVPRTDVSKIFTFQWIQEI